MMNETKTSNMIQGDPLLHAIKGHYCDEALLVHFGIVIQSPDWGLEGVHFVTSS